MQYKKKQGKINYEELKKYFTKDMGQAQQVQQLLQAAQSHAMLPQASSINTSLETMVSRLSCAVGAMPEK